MAADRPLDITVFGATGLVGKAGCRLLGRARARRRPGRAGGPLGGEARQVRADLPAGAREWPLVVTSSTDAESLVAMARGTRVVATTVGPYRREGLRVVEACADAGTDYADLTGEVLFVRDSSERDARAAATGARIVHSCGFDSIPSDLGV